LPMSNFYDEISSSSSLYGKKSPVSKYSNSGETNVHTDDSFILGLRVF
jgi:hypothetical protein